MSTPIQRNASSETPLPKLFHLYGRAYQHWADDAVCTDGTSVLRRKFPNQTEHFWEEMSSFLVSSGDRQMDKVNDWRAKADTSGKFQMRYQEWKTSMESKLEYRLSTETALSKEEKEERRKINDFIAERVGSSLVPGLGGRPSLLERYDIAVRSLVKATGGIWIDAQRRHLFLMLQDDLDKFHYE